jgi:hypothetical protein
MTRFELLEQIASHSGWIQFHDLPFPCWPRSCGEAVRVQLHRLRRWGLLEKQRRYPWRCDPFAYRFSLRRRERLPWARQKGLIER